MENTSRNGLRWSNFESRHLVRQFLAGKSVSDLAILHLRTKTAIRSRLISLGAVDPVLEKHQIISRVTGQPLLGEGALGIGLPHSKKFPRDRVSWSKPEIDLLVESYSEGLSISELAKLHRRHPISVLCPIYENHDWGIFEKEHESDEEYALRHDRLQNYYDHARAYCSPGCFSVETILSDITQEDYEAWLGPKYEEYHDEIDELSNTPSGTNLYTGYGEAGDHRRWDDSDQEHWHVRMSRPNDEAFENEIYSSQDDYDNYEYSYTDDDEYNTDERVAHYEHKYKDTEIFFVQSAYPNTQLGALARKHTDSSYSLVTMFGSDQSLPSEFENGKFESIHELQTRLNALKISYVE